MLQTDWVVFKIKCASASTSANTASTNVSNTAEPAHQGERQDSEEYEQEQEQNEQEEDAPLRACWWTAGDSTMFNQFSKKSLL